MNIDLLNYERMCLFRRLWDLGWSRTQEGERIAIWLGQIRRYLAVCGGKPDKGGSI